MKYRARRPGLRPLLLGLSLPLAGCGTIGSLADSWAWDAPPKIYGGLLNDVDAIGQGAGPCSPGPLMVVDLPFSFVFDSLLLPFTITWEIFFRPAPPPEAPREEQR